MSQSLLEKSAAVFRGANGQSSRRRGRAVVVGGSLAGMLAARVLARHFEAVTVIERDRLPDDPAPRRGVPQARHIHVLMPRGQSILEQFFPGLRDEMIAAGALPMDMARDVAWLTPEGWGLRYASGIEILNFTRGLLDWQVRQRLSAVPGVRFIDEAETTCLLPNAEGDGVGGVRISLRNRAAETPFVEIHDADFVVDASGRGSRAPQWLAALGYAAPAETIVDGFPGYASRLYRAAPGADWKGLYIQLAPPEQTRGGLIFPVEGDRWLVTLDGGGGDYPPADEAGFLDFAKSLPSPMLYDAIKDAAPLTMIHTYRAAENRLRHFERLARWPENFVVLGDAACAFNPVYGQGMTVAALGALTLDNVLRESKEGRGRARSPAGVAHRFQKRLAKVNRDPWLLATSEDFRFRETVGGAPTLVTKLMHRYTERVTQLSTESRDIRQRFLEVFGMIKPLSALFHPRVVWEVVKLAFRPAPVPKAPNGAARTIASTAT